MKRAAWLLVLGACSPKERAAPVETAAPTSSASAMASSAPAAREDAVVSIAPADPERGDRLVATTESGRRFDVTLALKREPLPERAPLACYRLARALDMEVVPETRAERLSLGDLVRWLSPTPKSLDHLQQVAAVSHDGTIAALMLERPSGEVVSAEDSTALRRVAKVATSLEPIDEAERSLVADYTRVVVLDYLAGNVLRGTVVLEAARGRIHLVNNESCFRGWIEKDALDGVLDKVRRVKRFPRGLRQRLEALDAAALDKLLRRPRHEEQVVGPRQLADYAERRGALLSLLTARAVQYGEDVAFGL